MAKKWFDSKVIKIEDESSTTKRFWVQVEGDEIVDFKAGQFVTLDLPISEKRTKRWRSYSIASAPDYEIDKENGGKVLELCIVQLPDGDGTRYLFEEAKVGTTIKFKGPSGAFVLPKVIDHEMVMVCTGTGVAPFRSMLHHIANHNIPHQGIHLIFGTREKAGILYRKEFKELAARIPKFTYSIALSREPDWTGWKGHVHQIYEHHHKDTSVNRKFYLCGWSRMIDEAVDVWLRFLNVND